MPFVPDSRTDTSARAHVRFVADAAVPADANVPERGTLRGAADLALEIVSAGVKGVKFFSDTTGTGNLISRSLSDIDQSVRGLQSDQAKEEDRRIAEIMRSDDGDRKVASCGASQQTFGGVRCRRAQIHALGGETRRHTKNVPSAEYDRIEADHGHRRPTAPRAPGTEQQRCLEGHHPLRCR